MVKETSPDRVDVRITKVRVVEYRYKWAETVRVEVVATDPPHATHEGVTEFLYWWSKDNLLEFEDIPPGGSAWAILQTDIVNLNNLNRSALQGLTNLDNYTAILAVMWDGKIVDAIEIEVKGTRGLIAGNSESGFAEVTEIGRPRLKEVHRLLRQRNRLKLQSYGDNSS